MARNYQCKATSADCFQHGNLAYRLLRSAGLQLVPRFVGKLVMCVSRNSSWHAFDLDDEPRVEPVHIFGRNVVQVSPRIADDTAIPDSVVERVVLVSVDPQRGNIEEV